MESPCASATALLDILERALHVSKSEWLFLRELRVGTGMRNGSLQRLDGFALNCLPHLAMKRICYEVKISRADFLSEVKQPLKRRIGMRYSNEFYFVAPGGLLKAAEIPVECGLMEAGVATFDEWRELIRRQAGFFYNDSDRREYCMVTVPAPELMLNTLEVKMSPEDTCTTTKSPTVKAAVEAKVRTAEPDAVVAVRVVRRYVSVVLVATPPAHWSPMGPN